MSSIIILISITIIISIINTQPTISPSESPTKFNVNYNSTYSKYLWIDEKTHWYRAQFLCEYIFGSNLATVISDEDWYEAQAVVHNLGLSSHPFYIGLNDNRGIQINCYAQDAWNRNYSWADGTPCNYTFTEQCKDDPRIDYGYYEDSTVLTKQWCCSNPCCAQLHGEGYLTEHSCIQQYGTSAIETFVQHSYFLCSANRKYAIVLEKHTSAQASNYCKSHYSGLGLAIIDSIADITEVESLSKVAGLFDQYLWIAQSGNNGCIVLFKSEILFHHDCHDKLSFICQLHESPTNPTAETFANQITDYWVSLEQYNDTDEYTQQSYEDAWSFARPAYNIQPLLNSAPTCFWNGRLYFMGYNYRLWSADVHIPDVNYDIDFDVLNNPFIQLDWSFNGGFVDYDMSACGSGSGLDSVYGMGGDGQHWMQFENMFFFMVLGEYYNMGDIEYRIVNIYHIDLENIEPFSYVSYELYTYRNTSENLSSEFNSNNPFWKFSTDTCMSSNKTHLFMVSNRIYFFKVKTDTTKYFESQDSEVFLTFGKTHVDVRSLYQMTQDLHPRDDFTLLHVSNDTLFDDFTSMSCSMGHDNKFLYIFGGYRTTLSQTNHIVFKYDVSRDKLYELNIHFNKSYILTKAILAPNGNIYFYGNVWEQKRIRNDEYLVFNSITERFYSNKFTKELFYKPNIASSASIYESNILIRIDYMKPIQDYKKVQNIDISYMITNRVCVDWRLLQATIDPSNNNRFSILRDHYKLLEFTNKPNIYSFMFYIHIFDMTLQKIVNISNQTCVFCDAYNLTKCFDCSVGIKLVANESLLSIGMHPITVDIQMYDNAGVDDLLLITNTNSDPLSLSLHIPCIIYFHLLDNYIINTGESIQIIDNYRFDSNCNIKDDALATFEFISEELSIKTDVLFMGEKCLSVFDSQFNRHSSCDNGIFPLLTDSTKQIYDIIIKSSESNDIITAIPSMISIKINECQLGKGIILNATIVECQTCQINQFKVFKGFAPCYDCKEQIDGVACLGSDQLLIDYNYWIAGYNENIFPIDIKYISNSNNDKMYAQACAPQYCCTQINGCSYINYNKSNELCAKGRNVSTILCSLCIENTYELFGGPNCGICEDYNFSFLAGIFVLSCLFVLFIFIDSTKTDLRPYQKDEINWKWLFIRDEMKAINIMILKIMTYYFQSLSQILSSKSINHAFVPILGFFDFSIDEINNTNNGICIIPHLDALKEIIFGLLFIMFIIFHFLWLSFAFMSYRRLYIKNNQPETVIEGIINQNKTVIESKIQSSDANMRCSVFKNKKPVIKMAMLKIFIICTGSILKMSFKLVSCVELPNGSAAHLYNAEQNCYDGYFFFGLCNIICITIFYLYLFMVIHKQKNKVIKNPTHKYYKFISSFKHEFWYYEFILFSRRLLIAMFASFQHILNDQVFNLILVGILAIYVCYHSRIHPFNYYRLNLLESICLISLLIITARLMSIDSNTDDKITNIFISLVVLIPFIIFFLYFIQMIICIFVSFKSPTNFTKYDLIKIEKIISRAPIKIDFNHTNNNNSNGNIKSNGKNDTNKEKSDDSDHKELALQTQNNPRHSTSLCHDSGVKNMDAHDFAIHKNDNEVSRSALDYDNNNNNNNSDSDSDNAKKANDNKKNKSKQKQSKNDKIIISSVKYED